MAAAPRERIRRTRAAEAPIASPSAPTCVVTATRSRVFRNSATSGAVLFFVRVVIFPYLPQGALYPGCLLHDRVGLEAQARRPLQTRLSTEAQLYPACCALEPLLRLLCA